MLPQLQIPYLKEAARSDQQHKAVVTGISNTHRHSVHSEIYRYIKSSTFIGDPPILPPGLPPSPVGPPSSPPGSPLSSPGPCPK